MPALPVNDSADSHIEVIFLGSGSSATVPAVRCLTDEVGCRACESATERDSFDKRRNTSVAIRLRDVESGELKTVLIDCGKEFYDAAGTFFPEHGLRNIDAILFSHEHRDAIGGFDDLRDWIQVKSMRTSRLMLQGGLDTYGTQYTLDHIRAYSDHNFGARAIKDNKVVREHVISEIKPFTLFGHLVTPLKVQHGVHTDGSTYYSLGYMFDEDVAYIGDYSLLLPETAAILAKASPSVIILDATANLRRVQGSHAGLPYAVEIAQTMPLNRRVYLTGIEHDHTHADWAAACKAVDGSTPPPSPIEIGLGAVDQDFVTAAVSACADVRDVDKDIWVRPARDGLHIVVNADGRVRDCDND